MKEKLIKKIEDTYADSEILWLFQKCCMNAGVSGSEEYDSRELLDKIRRHEEREFILDDCEKKKRWQLRKEIKRYLQDLAEAEGSGTITGKAEEDTGKQQALLGKRKDMRVFIVHGHDTEEKWALKNYLQNTLKLDEPVILAEKASGGRTIIEKFEKYAEECSLVFVLLTPDDKYSDNGTFRSRQNVIFEMGYFLGKIGRKSGRVILLYKGKLELPNDISGIVYINIDHGIEAAGEQIRKEIEEAVRE